MNARIMPYTNAASVAPDNAAQSSLVRNPQMPSPLFIGWGPRLR